LDLKSLGGERAIEDFAAARLQIFSQFSVHHAALIIYASISHHRAMLPSWYAYAYTLSTSVK